MKVLNWALMTPTVTNTIWHRTTSIQYHLKSFQLIRVDLTGTSATCRKRRMPLMSVHFHRLPGLFRVRLFHISSPQHYFQRGEMRLLPTSFSLMIYTIPSINMTGHVRRRLGPLSPNVEPSFPPINRVVHSKTNDECRGCICGHR